MFSLNEDNRYVVCLQGVDLRKGVDGLCGVIRYLSLNPANGDVYVFLNKTRTCFRQWDTLKVFGDYAKQLLLFDVHIKQLF